MEKENDIPPSKALDEVLHDLPEKTDLRSLAIDTFVGEFEQNYQIFRRLGEKHKATLAVFDFKSTDPENESFANGARVIVVPGDRFFVVDYSIIFHRFLSIFDKDRIGLDHFAHARAERAPDLDTPSSLKFIEENPGQKANLDFIMFAIDTDWNMNEMVLRQRFTNPQTNEPISEAWISYRTESLQ